MFSTKLKTLLVIFLTAFLSINNAFAEKVVKPTITFYMPKKINQFLSRGNISNYSETRVGYNNSCGPMSMLFIHNYITYIKEGKPDHLSGNIHNVKAAIERQYKAIGIRNNILTQYSELRQLGVNWGFYSKVFSDKSGFPNARNVVEHIKNGLELDRMTVVNLKKEGAVLNPYKMEHFIVIIKITANNRNPNDLTFTYFDPWDGRIKNASFKDMTSSWIGSHSVLQVGVR